MDENKILPFLEDINCDFQKISFRLLTVLHEIQKMPESNILYLLLEGMFKFYNIDIRT